MTRSSRSFSTKNLMYINISNFLTNKPNTVRNKYRKQAHHKTTMKIKATSVKISEPVILITSIIKTLNGTVGVKNHNSDFYRTIHELKQIDVQIKNTKTFYCYCDHNLDSQTLS